MYGTCTVTTKDLAESDPAATKYKPTYIYVGSLQYTGQQVGSVVSPYGAYSFVSFIDLSTFSGVHSCTLVAQQITLFYLDAIFGNSEFSMQLNHLSSLAGVSDTNTLFELNVFSYSYSGIYVVYF